jgi:histidinol-phosphate phosphatase family domain/HAD-superfamily hydrolase, subfamily IIIA
MTGLHRALFLDRDGVINVDKGYVCLPEAIEWIPGVAEAIHYANSLNYRVIVISNQSGVARGYFTENDVKSLHEWMSRELQRSGALIDAFYYCPHHPDFGGPCDCRKPEPGLYLRAARDFTASRSRDCTFAQPATSTSAFPSASLSVTSLAMLIRHGGRAFPHICSAGATSINSSFPSCGPSLPAATVARENSFDEQIQSAAV